MTVIHAHSFSYFFQCDLSQDAEYTVLYCRTLLFIHSVYTSLHVLVLNSGSNYLSLATHLATTSLFSMSLICFYFIDRFICVIF